jgi:hypothetical protein
VGGGMPAGSDQPKIPGVPQAGGTAAASVAAGSARKHATRATADEPLAQPSAWTMGSSCACFAVASIVMLGEPDMESALVKSPAAAGAAKSAKMSVPPDALVPNPPGLGSEVGGCKETERVEPVCRRNGYDLARRVHCEHLHLRSRRGAANEVATVKVDQNWKR